MMTFDDFLITAEERIRSSLPDAEIAIRHFPKLQGGSYVGISVQPKGGAAAASFNVAPVFERLCADRSRREAILDELVAHVKQGVSMIPAFDFDAVTDYETAKDRLTIQVVPVGPNAEMLNGIPHRTMEDIAAVYRVELSGGEMGTVSTLITDRILEDYGITAEQLHADAVRSQILRHPPVLKNASEIMAELSEGAAELPESRMWIATVEGGRNGASVILLPGFLERSAERLGGDFFVLPSSIHEVILVPDDGFYRSGQLERMVRSVNAAEVSEVDFLSDSVYHYDSAGKILETAASFECRRRRTLS